MDILEEREYQDSKWGHEFDNRNTASDWHMYLTDYSGKACRVIFSSERRKLLVKTAAIALAALEAFDRNGGFPPSHYEHDQRPNGIGSTKRYTIISDDSGHDYMVPIEHAKDAQIYLQAVEDYWCYMPEDEELPEEPDYWNMVQRIEGGRLTYENPQIDGKPLFPNA